MPYKYKRYARKKITKRAPGQSSAGSALVAARRALRLAQVTAGKVEGELKHYDETNTVSPDNSGGNVSSVVRGIAQGTSDNQITGNSVMLKSIRLRGSCVIDSLATATRIRLLFVLDKRPESSVPAITDILASASIHAFMNIDNQRGRFQVLKDVNINLDQTQYDEVTREFYVSWPRGYMLQFNDSQVPIKGDILMVALSDEATNKPSVSYMSRIMYVDN